MNIYNAAIIGAGKIAERHIQACVANDKVKIAAIAEIELARAEELCRRYGLKAEIYTDYKKMLNEVKADFAIINLPHNLHKEASLYCAGKGCSILLEKPISTCLGLLCKDLDGG